MINFTVGPVQSWPETLSIGAEQVPYFRTLEFSRATLESERLLLRLAGAPEGSRAVFLTGSGTAAMEAAVMGLLGPGDRAVAVDGGTFGHRFCELLDLHGVPHDRVELAPGEALREGHLAPLAGKGHTAFLVNLCETSTGALYDLGVISSFCEREGALLVVDAVSAFLADPFDMAACGADVMVTGSQKALACPPGVSMVLLGPRALGRVGRRSAPCMYLDLSRALTDGERGQTPFTPAVGTLLQVNARLNQLVRDGGAAAEVARTAGRAAYFRAGLAGLPLTLLPESPSNCVTALRTARGTAREVFATLKDEFGMWVCPNGGELSESVFRVGHLGALARSDYDALLGALRELAARGVI